MITQWERLAISALGPEVVRLAECPERERPPQFWRELLVTLYRTNPDVMETLAGLRFAHAVVCRMEKEALTDGYIPTGKVGKHNLAAGWYSFAEALSVVAEYLVAQGHDRAVLKGLRASGMTVREYMRAEFDIIAGPREGYTRRTPDRADMKSFRFALDTARWVARRRTAEERRRRKWSAVQAWRAETPAIVM